MAKRVTITNQGAALLASSSQATGQYYWLGYYALAYVPNLWKEATVTLPTSPDDCDAVNEGTPVGSGDTDQVIAAMTNLTVNGDIIYNIWQGDLNGTGFYGCQSDGSAGGDLFGLTMYNTNVKKHYRYVLDDNGNNTLVTWLNDGTNDGYLIGKHVYKGTDGYVPSRMPIPAPLYYLGDVTGKVSVDNFFDSFPTFEEETGPTGNGSDIYPYLSALGLKDTVTSIDVPKISADYRGYLDSQGNDGSSGYDHTTAGQYFDSLEIPYAVDSGFDETSWFAADLSHNIDDYSASGWGFSPTITEFWKLLSISNYNRFHAPTSSIGHVLSSDLTNRNMAKVTKFFPISNYKVVNTETGFTANNESVEIATAIKLGIDIDLAPRALAQGFDDTTCDYDETNNIEFFERYDRTGLGTPHPTTLGDGSTTPNDNLNGTNIFSSTHTSFKFNRIGIYAVPLRKSPYVNVQNTGVTNVKGTDVELQFQINPDEEPTLFAVIDWDNTVSLSDTGDGIHEFKAEFSVNLESPDGIEDSALLRDATIFYNLYEDDAITWYQNQLIANASTQNAITELGLEIASVKSRLGEGECCPPPDLSGLYAPLNHSHIGLGLRNLLDANTATDGGLKGIDTAVEGSTIEGETYKLGIDSIALGSGTSAAGQNSSVLGGVSNYITSDIIRGAIVGGAGNRIIDKGDGVIIGSGVGNLLTTNCVSTAILTGTVNKAVTAYHSAIVSGNDNKLESTSGYMLSSVIGAGSFNSITDSDYSGILGGGSNYITVSDYSIVNGGYSNGITRNKTITAVSYVYAFIGGGYDNTIDTASHTAIVGGNSNTILSQNNDNDGVSLNADFNFSFIGGGHQNKIDTSRIAAILGGEDNYIYGQSNLSAVIAGNVNYIYGGSWNNLIGAGYNNSISNSGGSNSLRSIIGAGTLNSIEASDDSAIVSGSSNRVYNTTGSFIGAGTNNIITRSYSSIVGGNTNVTNGDQSIIGGGANNYIDVATYAGIFSGNDNYIHNYATASAILAGDGNTIGTYSGYSVIGGGHLNYIDDNGGIYRYITVSGGYDNEVLNGSAWASIIGGESNSITNAGWAVIGGRQNRIENSGAGVVFGDNNRIYNPVATASAWNGVLSGSNNWIADANSSVIAGGFTNKILGVANYSTISGGNSNQILDTAVYSTIIGGYGAKTSNRGEVAHANGYFVDIGDCQHSIMMSKLSLNISNGGINSGRLTLDGTTCPTVPLDSTYSGILRITANYKPYGSTCDPTYGSFNEVVEWTYIFAASRYANGLINPVVDLTYLGRSHSETSDPSPTEFGITDINFNADGGLYIDVTSFYRSDVPMRWNAVWDGTIIKSND